MANGNEQVLAAARKRGKKKDIDLGDGVQVTVRELSRTERKELYERMFMKGPDDKFIIVDKNDKPTTEDGFYKVREGVVVMREWLLAAMTPAEAVDGILADDVPDSVKLEIFEEARKINGIEPASEIAKNS
jgi:hypothetical protein